MILVYRGKVAVGVLCASLGFVASTICPATVFTSSVSLLPNAPFPPNGQPGFEIQAWTQPNNSGDGAFLDMTISPGLVLSPYDWTVGIAHKWYGANLGDAFTIADHSSFPLFADTSTYPVTLGNMQLSVGEDFYLAFWLVDGPPGLGWAHLQLTSPTSLVLLGNAIDNSGAGIYVGTTTVVPEPSALTLSLLSGILLIPTLRLRRRSMQTR
jgi:hypothetical protein